MPDIDAEIDRLYQLPLEDFTTARNALAKGAKQLAVKALEKPNVAAWAVNQLYWHHRRDYDRVVKSAEQLRAAHRKLLGGKASDLREPEKAHREAVRNAAERIKELLAAGGHAASDQTLNAVQETLEAIPSAEPPGRLTRPLRPLGFEALAGLSFAAPAKPALRIVPPAKSTDAAPAPDAKRERELARQREQEERERKERRREAEKELKAAEAAMLRAEDAVKKAEKTLSDLRSKRDEAVSQYQRARLRVHE